MDDHRRIAASTLGLLVLFGLAVGIAGRDPEPGVPEPARAHADRVAALRTVTSWAPLFGGVPPRQVGDHDLIVVDGSRDRDGHQDTTAGDVARWQEEGRLVLAYLSVGTLETWREHTRDVPADALMGPEGDWPDEWYVDTRNEVWQQRVLEGVDHLAAAGFDGLYLDYVDVVDDHPWTTEGLVGLVRRIHEHFPSLLLVAQNGLTVADQLPVDALAQEETFWRWDWETERYRESTAAERTPLLEGLRSQRVLGVPILTVDYTEPDCRCAEVVVDRALREGFVPAVSVLALDRLPHASP